MNPVCCICAGLCLVICATAAPATSAEQLLESVISRLPQSPLNITGELKVRKRRGIVVRELGFRMHLDWGSSPATARYTIRDAFGRDLEQLTVRRSRGEEPSFEYAHGDPLVPGKLPDLNGPVQNTDLTWMDLTLSFLWWKGGVIVGSDVIRGRPCHIVEIPAPASGDGSEEPGYSNVKLWIDEEIHMLLQAQACDADGRAVRRLWIKSIKKVNERWMIKDLEVQMFPAVHRTKLTVREVREG